MPGLVGTNPNQVPTNADLGQLAYKDQAALSRDATGLGLQTYADNTAALAGGLVAGQLYRTSTGVVMVVY